MCGSGFLECARLLNSLLYVAAAIPIYVVSRRVASRPASCVAVFLAEFGAASADDRASVMDYPHPYVTLTEDNEVDLSDAYAVGIVAWDKQAVRWGYSDFPDDTDAVAARAELMKELLTSGLSFVADKHARAESFGSGTGPSHSRGSLLDNGGDPVAELNRVMALRRVVLDNFSEAVIRKGQPLAKIEDALVPAYLMHRNQLQAAATVLGGRDFTYALKGDGQAPTAMIDGERQWAALTAWWRRCPLPLLRCRLSWWL